MSTVSKQPVSSFSPYYGCAIMIAAMLIFGGIIAWSAYTLFTQDAEIDRITGPEPAAFPSHELPPALQTQLDQKLTAFAESATAGQIAALELSIAELNALLGMTPDLGNGTYQDLMRFTSALPAENALQADISLPLNRIQFWEDKKRYLVGSATFGLEVGDAGPDIRIRSVQVPGVEVPAGFIDNQALWTWVSPFLKDTHLAAILKTIRSATVTDAGVLLSTQPSR